MITTQNNKWMVDGYEYPSIGILFDIHKQLKEFSILKIGVPSLVYNRYLAYVDLGPLREFSDFIFVEVKPSHSNEIWINYFREHSCQPINQLHMFLQEIRCAS